MKAIYLLVVEGQWLGAVFMSENGFVCEKNFYFFHGLFPVIDAFRPGLRAGVLTFVHH